MEAMVHFLLRLWLLFTRRSREKSDGCRQQDELEKYTRVREAMQQYEAEDDRDVGRRTPGMTNQWPDIH